ncbi:hypothetical protein Tco_0915297 [Tanacetum coccineum]
MVIQNCREIDLELIERVVVMIKDHHLDKEGAEEVQVSLELILSKQQEVLLLEVDFDGAFSGERDFFLEVKMVLFGAPHLRIQGFVRNVKKNEFEGDDYMVKVNCRNDGSTSSSLDEEEEENEDKGEGDVFEESSQEQCIRHRTIATFLEVLHSKKNHGSENTKHILSNEEFPLFYIWKKVIMKELIGISLKLEFSSS